MSISTTDIYIFSIALKWPSNLWVFNLNVNEPLPKICRSTIGEITMNRQNTKGGWKEEKCEYEYEYEYDALIKLSTQIIKYHFA